MPAVKRNASRRGTSKSTKGKASKSSRINMASNQTGYRVAKTQGSTKKIQPAKGRIAAFTTYEQVIHTYNTIYDQETRDIYATVEYMQHSLIPVD